MKNASLPPLRVTEELRASAEALLREGESLSAFVEESVRLNVERRRVQADFIARGLASAERARRTGVYHEVEDVLQELTARRMARTARR